MTTRAQRREALNEAVLLLRRLRQVVEDYRETLIEIATQTRGKGAEIARRALERQN